MAHSDAALNLTHIPLSFRLCYAFVYNFTECTIHNEFVDFVQTQRHDEMYTILK